MNQLSLSIVATLICSTSVAAISNAPVETRHGYVVAREVVKDDKSSVPAGAIIGGLIGLATAHGDGSGTKARRTVGGAVAGGVIGNQVDRSKRQWLYTIRFPAGDEMQILLDDDVLATGDCAAVTHGTQSTRVRYSSPYFCNNPAGGQWTQAEPEELVDDPCLEAKRRLLDAYQPDEIEVLERKVKIICGEQ